MKRNALVIVFAALVGVASAQAEVNVSVSIGTPPPQRVIVLSPPVVRFEAPPLFISSSRLGFYVGVDTPYDIIFSSDYFYLYYGNSWHRSERHDGPWVEVPYRELPPGIRKHRIEQIRSYRDREYRAYRNDHEQYRGRYFRPDHERKQEIKDDRRREKQEWQDERRSERNERKDEKRERRQHGHDRE